MLYLHETGQGNLAMQLAQSFAIVDHNDPDILLSHFVLRNGADYEFLKRHETLLKSAALYLDYKRPIGTLEERLKGRMLTYITWEFGRMLERDEISLAGVAREIRAALEFLDAFDVTDLMGQERDPMEVLLDELRASEEGQDYVWDAENRYARVAGSEASYLEYFFNRAVSTVSKLPMLEAFVEEGIVAAGERREIKQADASELEVSRLRKVGPAIVLYYPEKQIVNDRIAINYLESIDPKILNNSLVLISIYRDAKDKMRFKLTPILKDGRQGEDVFC